MKRFYLLFLMPVIPLFSAQYATQNGTITSKESLLLRASNIRSPMEMDSSPYIYSDTGITAKVGNSKEEVTARYNAVKDEVEYIHKGVWNTLYKRAEFSPVIFQNNEVLWLRSYIYNGAKKEGYLYELPTLYSKKIYYRISKKFVPEVRTMSSFEQDQPAKYVDQPIVFFIENEEGEIVEFPKNKKGLMALFPSRKEVISKEVKSYKMNYTDIKKVMNTIFKNN